MSSMLAKGTPVISLKTGVTLGKVVSVYMDCGSRRLVAFSFGRGGAVFGRKGGHIVEVADVHAIGPDAVTLNDARVVHDLVLMDGATRNLIELDQLVKRDVMTDDGSRLGHIVGLDFDPRTYRLLQIRIDDRRRVEELLIAGSDIVSIGEEIIVVRQPTAFSGAPARAISRTRMSPLMSRERFESDLQRAG